MNYLRLPHMDGPVSFFDICQAHQQLEADYNFGGWLRERPSNQRRRASTGWQLLRMGFRSAYRWVDIYTDRSEDDDPDDDDVRDIYLINVLKWDLPIGPVERDFIRRRYTPEFLSRFPSMQETTA